MQATIVMLMALTSLGCKHKSCEVAPVASCNSSCSSVSYTTVLTGCYTNSSCYSNSCYTESCYSSCQTSKHGHRNAGHGLFHKKCGCRTAPVVASCCSSSPAVYGGYSSVSYDAPVYAAAQSPMVSAQNYSAPVAVSKVMPYAVAPAKAAPQSIAAPVAVPTAPSGSVPPPPAAATDVVPAGAPLPVAVPPVSNIPVTVPQI